MDARHLIKQKSYEKIIHILRRHPVTFVPTLLLFLLLLALPIGVFFIISSLFPELLNGPIIYPTAVLAASVFYLAIIVFFFTQFIDFYLDLWVVTNDRIVDIEQFGLFARTVSEVDLFRIQDVTTNVHGFFSTIFNYGVITIKTASDNKSIVFKNIPRPNAVREKLIRLSDEDRKYHYAK